MPTEQKPQENVPAVVCTLCNAPIDVLRPVDELPDVFEASCAKCGNVSKYRKGEIKVLTQDRG